jgi:hypothetical protein
MVIPIFPIRIPLTPQNKKSCNPPAKLRPPTESTPVSQRRYALRYASHRLSGGARVARKHQARIELDPEAVRHGGGAPAAG